MTDRRGLEFKKPVKLEMWRRAGGPESLCCEGCDMPIGKKPFEYDHTLEIWELPSDLREEFRRSKKGVPAEYGKLLCIPCHDEKSGKKTGERAHCDRIIEKEARADVRKSAPIPGSKKSGIKFKMDGSAICRRTGKIIKKAKR